MAPEKQVKIKVATDVDLEKVKALEDEVNRLKRQRLEFDIQANTDKLSEIQSKINSIEKTIETRVDLSDEELQQLKSELAALESDKLDIQLDIEQSKLEATKSEIDALEDDPINLDLDTSNAMAAIEQIGQGFDRLKAGAAEIGAQLGSVLEASGKQETNRVFLEMSVGAEKAAQSMQTINQIVRDLPGDDTALQGLLSSAAAKNASITAAELKNMGIAAADYFSAMSYYGKSATEAQQDMTNYILAGNTAELERSPILQSHIDKLKEANTPQERALALQKALQEEGWAGMSQQDTYNNKLETFNGMLERGKYNLGAMFQEGAKWGMDFIMKLDEASNGLVGMGIALAGFASPVAEALMGLGQMANGIKVLQESRLGEWAGTIKDSLTSIGQKAKAAAASLLTDLRGALVSAGNAARAALTNMLNFARSLASTIVNAIKSAAISLANLAKQVLVAGYNALKSAAMWAVEKAALVASTIAEYAAAAAQWALNIAMSANPIGILIIAITALIAILGYLYFNNEQVRAAIDGLGQTFMMVGQIIYDTFMNIIQWVISGLQMLWEYIFTVGGLIPANVEITGNQVIDTIIRVMAFVATLPIQLAMIFANAIAQVLGFGNNFVQRMFTSAQNAVNRFMTQIKSLPGKFQAELNNMLSAVDRWAATLPAKFWQAGVNAVKNFLSALGIASPGTMQRMMIWEVTEMGKRVPVEGKRLVSNIGTLGEDVVNAFDPNLKGISVANNALFTGANSGSGVNGGGDINITINGDVDSEDRVKFFVEAIRKELAWDNTTAGRTN